jgi:hypothetical protein
LALVSGFPAHGNTGPGTWGRVWGRVFGA